MLMLKKKTLTGNAEARKEGDSSAPPAETVSPGDLRMQRDIAELEQHESVKFTWPDQKNVRDMVVDVTPTDGLWKAGRFLFSIKVSPEYPHQPPAVLCTSKMYHPNISLEGKVCLNILKVNHYNAATGQEDGWKPVFNMNTVMWGLLTLFTAPDPTDPLNIEAAKMMREEPEKFKKNVDASIAGKAVMVGAQSVQFPCLTNTGVSSSSGGGGGGGGGGSSVAQAAVANGWEGGGGAA